MRQNTFAYQTERFSISISFHFSKEKKEKELVSMQGIPFQ